MGLPIIAANPVDTPELYDSLYLVGQKSPGLCTFDGLPTRDEGWDIQAPPGGGGFTIHKRTAPIVFKVKLYLWKGDDDQGGQVDHFAAWETWKKVLFTPVKPNSPKALDIYHPQLEGLNPAIRSVVIKSHTDPGPDGKGGAWVEIVMLEYRPFIRKPVKQLVGTTTSKNDPNAALKAQVAQAVADFNNP